MTHGTQYHPRKQFTVGMTVFTTSSKTQQKETDWCVGVGRMCRCHTDIADSKTQEIALGFPNREFLAFLSLSA